MMKFGRLTAPLLAAIASAESSEHVNYAFLAGLRAKAQSKGAASSSTATSMATRVAGEVGYAERAVEAELRKEHAPIALQQQEKRLLDGALKSANEAAHAAKQEDRLRRGMRSSRKASVKSLAGLEAKAAVGAERIVKNINRVEEAVEEQLEKDHAPAALRAEEASLLSRAAKAESGAVNELKGLLRNRRAQKTKATAALVSEKASSGLGAMAAHVAHEVSDAERAVEAELKKEHAPVALQQEEKKLLDGALAAADKVAHESRHKATHEAKTRSKTSLRSMAAELAHSVSEDRARLKETKFVEGEAMKALQEEHVGGDVQRQVASLLHKAENLEKKEVVVAQKDLRNMHSLERQELKKRHGSSAEGAAKSAAGMEEQFNNEMQKIAKADASRARSTQSIEVVARKALEEVHADSATEEKVQDLLEQAEASERREAAIEGGTVSRTKAVSKQQMDQTFSKEMHQLVTEEKQTLKETTDVRDKAQEALEAAGADSSTLSKVQGLLEQAEMYEKKDIQLTAKGAVVPPAAPAVEKKVAVDSEPEDPAAAALQRLSSLQKENAMLRGENKRLRQEHNELLQEVHLEAENTALIAQNKVLERQNTQLDEKLDEKQSP